MSVREQVFGALHRCVEALRLPALRRARARVGGDLRGKSGEEIASQELYSLTDRGGRRLGTAAGDDAVGGKDHRRACGRASVPVRWYCNVNCHRYERPQRGRTREHWQINVDIFGSDSPNCEVEIFEVVTRCSPASARPGTCTQLRVNDRVLLHGLLTDVIGISAAQVRPVSSILDRWAKYPRAEQLAAAAKAGLSERKFGHLEAVLGAGQDLLARLPGRRRSGDPAWPRSSTAPTATWCSFDPLIVRGFEYYTSTVFEVFDTDPANARSLFGGGRLRRSDQPVLCAAHPRHRLRDGRRHADGLPRRCTACCPAPLAASQVAVLPLDRRLHAAARAVAAQLREPGTAQQCRSSRANSAPSSGAPRSLASRWP